MTVYSTFEKLPTSGTRRGRKPDSSGLIAYYEFMLRLSRIRGRGYCTLTNADFADALGFHTSTGSSYLRRLKDIGVVYLEYDSDFSGAIKERRIYPLASLKDLIRQIGGKQ